MTDLDRRTFTELRDDIQSPEHLVQDKEAKTMNLGRDVELPRNRTEARDSWRQILRGLDDELLGALLTEEGIH